MHDGEKPPRRGAPPASHSGSDGGGAPATTRRQVRWTVSGMPTGWTVFEIPSTSRPLLSVGWEMCGPDHRLQDKGAIVLACPGRPPARELDGGVAA